MNEIESRNVQCPYCGEIVDIFIDCSVGQQNYIEDCQVCCRPINIDISVQNGELTLLTTHENE